MNQIIEPVRECPLPVSILLYHPGLLGYYVFVEGFRRADIMATFLRRASNHVLRNSHQRGGHGWPGGSFWAEGTSTGRNGYLFGETPPPAGQKRKWESWEFVL